MHTEKWGFVPSSENYHLGKKILVVVCAAGLVEL